jgi:hypothetical protein
MAKDVDEDKVDEEEEDSEEDSEKTLRTKKK